MQRNLESVMIVLVTGVVAIALSSIAYGKDVRATGYYTIYESEMDGTQTVSRIISGRTYTLKASFLFGGFGVAMQGTGRIGPDGDYIHYDGGGGPGDIGDFVPITNEVKQRYAELGITDFAGFGGLAIAYPRK